MNASTAQTDHQESCRPRFTQPYPKPTGWSGSDWGERGLDEVLGWLYLPKTPQREENPNLKRIYAIISFRLRNATSFEEDEAVTRSSLYLNRYHGKYDPSHKPDCRQTFDAWFSEPVIYYACRDVFNRFIKMRQKREGAAQGDEEIARSEANASLDKFEAEQVCTKASDRREAIREAIKEEVKTLPPTNERKVVELTLEGLPDAEIAKQLGMTEEAVRAARCRAVKKLRIKTKDILDAID